MDVKQNRFTKRAGKQIYKNEKGVSYEGCQKIQVSFLRYRKTPLLVPPTKLNFFKSKLVGGSISNRVIKKKRSVFTVLFSVLTLEMSFY